VIGRRRPGGLPLRAIVVTGLCALAAATGSAVVAPLAWGQASWSLDQPPPPPGARFKVPLGPPGDMRFLAANHGLLAVEGNSTIPRGLYFWDGVAWHQLSTVCGGPGQTARIAWAGNDEFWTVTEPSAPRAGSGLGLCHFKNGEVVGSYSTPIESADPYRTMDAAACHGPDDCWFGGVGGQDPSGQRVGAFHLHWDGSNLISSYQPQGRGVSGLTYFGGTFYESVLVGAAPEDSSDPVTLASPEPQGPVLIHRFDGSTFRGTGFTARQYSGQPADGGELLAAGSDATDLWFSGGGAASGPSAPQGGSVSRPPFAVHFNDPFFQEVAIDNSQFGLTDRFVDIAPVPGTSTAWVADQPFADRGSSAARARVALLGTNGSTQVTTLPSSGGGRGSAARVAFTGPSEGWMATSAGWLFHYSDGTVYPRDTDPYFQGTITTRPNEAAAQFVSDTPPPDDSQLFAPPPVQVQQQAATGAQRVGVILPLLAHIKVKRRGLILLVSFRLTRLATVELVARRHRAVVARTGRRRLKAGAHMLRLRLNLKRYPTALAFRTKELTRPTAVLGPATSGSGSDTVGTGSGSGSGSVVPPSRSGSDTVSTGG